MNLLVIHNISLPPGEFAGCFIDDFFCNTLDTKGHAFFDEIAGLKVSAHLLIDRAGDITQYVPFNRKAWHAGESCFKGRKNCNDYSIGVELEGTDNDRFTDAQYSTLIDITRLIAREYPCITPERIVGHSDIAPGRKTDPGPCFDWQRFKSKLSFDH
ncbi:MAG: 1,6-anhydro-N-acetylmuramyl-L-alanine amidase AmpD [Gammaproteobacteria bacterium]|nr:1,6-anhydro-N-acetylmuramyl-L-alanine amidase AmpD [Gammaproteobacteria bacterium]